MANKLTRFDPFNEVKRFEAWRGMEDFFRNFALRPWGVDTTEPSIRLDVQENDRDYLVKADIPGVKKEDIRIDISGHRVSIDVESKRESEEKSGDFVRSERYYGQQSRVFTLAHELDDSQCKASYKDGVLELSIPKKEGSSGKRIAVE